MFEGEKKHLIKTVQKVINNFFKNLPATHKTGPKNSVFRDLAELGKQFGCPVTQQK